MSNNYLDTQNNGDLSTGFSSKVHVQQKKDLHPSYRFIDERICTGSGNNPENITFINLQDKGEGIHEVSFIFRNLDINTESMVRDDGSIEVTDNAIKSTKNLMNELRNKMEAIPGVMERGAQVEAPFGHYGVSFLIFDLLDQNGYQSYLEYTGFKPDNEYPQNRKSAMEELKEPFPSLSGIQVQKAAMVHLAEQIGMIESTVTNAVYETGLGLKIDSNKFLSLGICE
ncbi:MAG: hypothetical protein COA45_08645 [Zetaproteobacteria bacterium]|nr:MAG: hypothetical protein COA45_08645 [Zetaproteobacteria bacterium]